MDRPNNGHSRHEAGSITVMDLIRRQQDAGRILSDEETSAETTVDLTATATTAELARVGPTADEATTIRFVDDLLADTIDEPAHHGWLSRSAKAAGLALGSLALCGSMYTASTFAHHRPVVADQPGTPGTSVLTGVGALRPDTVAAQLSGSRQYGASHSPDGASGRETGTIVGRPESTPTPAPPHPTPPREQEAAAPQRATAAPTSPDAVVRAFYQLAATEPSLAAQLIAPSLLSTDATGFDAAWSSMARIEVASVQQLSTTAVQAVVRMREPDGTWLQVVELLHVTGGDAPLISGAELLSAQHG